MQHNYEAIVQMALTEPGKIAAAYSALHDFSIGNQWLAIMQLGQPEPIATFPGWKAVGRRNSATVKRRNGERCSKPRYARSATTFSDDALVSQ